MPGDEQTACPADRSTCVQALAVCCCADSALPSNACEVDALAATCKCTHGAAQKLRRPTLSCLFCMLQVLQQRQLCLGSPLHQMQVARGRLVLQEAGHTVHIYQVSCCPNAILTGKMLVLCVTLLPPS